jgi:hypothetical protein
MFQNDFNKFKKLTNWMVTDLSRSMFEAKANFLVALGLVIYTETLGSFLKPYRTDRSGRLKLDKNGKKIKTTTGERFYEFFKRLGPEYVDLRKRFWGENYRKVYDDLRNGLAHEYLIKRRDFTVWGTKQTFLTDVELLRSAKCGLAYDKAQKKWHFITPRYLGDLKNAIKKYIEIIENRQDKALLRNFKLRAREVNLRHFS